MDKSEMMYKIDKEVSSYIKKYEEFSNYSITSTFQVNKTDKYHRVRYQIEGKNLKFPFSFLLEYDSDTINTAMFESESLNFSEEYSKVEQFYKYFKNIPQENLIKIYELTNWKD